MSYTSDPADLALHGVRVLGSPSTSRIADRYGLDAGVVSELLLDFEAFGWVRQHHVMDVSGWSLTDAGRRENERRLAAELDVAGARDTVTDAHARFLPLNGRLSDACTRWQVRPTAADPMASNDHTDWRWDERVLETLTSIDRSFRQLCQPLSTCLARFDGYAHRYSTALAEVANGHRSWVDASDKDSCHLVWIQFHEDLLATLGLDRGADN